MINFDAWEYAQETSRKKRMSEAQEFLDKVGYDFNKDELSIADDFRYMFVKPEVDELVQEHNKAMNSLRELHNPYLDTRDLNGSYKAAENVGKQRSDRNNLYQASKGFDKIYYSEFDEHGNRLYKGIVDHEAGYSNREHDLGGPTNFGIIQKTLNDYHAWNSHLKKGKNFPKTVKQLNQEQGRQILDEMFFQRYAINKITNVDIVRTVFDECMNQTVDAGKDLALAMSELKGKKYFQNQVITDTLANAVNSLTKDETIKVKDRLFEFRMERFFNSVDKHPETNTDNLKGWYNRLVVNHSKPQLFEKKYKKKVDNYITEKYRQYYTGK